MYKRLLSILLSISIVVCSMPLSAKASDVKEKEESISSAVDISSAVSLNAKTIEEMLAQYKYSARQGHGFAAERANNLFDRVKGKNARVVGDNNVENGPDRLILNRDGTSIYIQSKYYATAREGINACFDAKGVFRYVDGDGHPMIIEVPKDQYQETVELMRKKISEGKIPGVTDPNEAKNLVKEGKVTYKQAQNLAKAGTVESLMYDAKTGVVSAVGAFGISAAINYTIYRINGYDRTQAAKNAADEGLKTGVLIFASSVIASQLSKTALKNAFKPTSEAIVKACGDEFAKSLLSVAGKNVAETGTQMASKTLTENAAKALRANAILVIVEIVVFSVPDAIDLFSGRISQKQFVKNFAVTAVALVAGTAGMIGGAALGGMFIPGVGMIPGSAIGSFLGGMAAGIGAGALADIIADHITEDDADEMYAILQERFVQNCEDYMVTEDEATEIIDEFSRMLNEDMYKDMYQCEDRKAFADSIMNPLFEKVVAKRPVIEELTEEELRIQLKRELAEVVLIH